MDETLQAPSQEQAPEAADVEAVQKEAMAHRAEAMAAADSARANLGTAAIGQEVNFDSHGNMLTPRDMHELREKGPEINQ